ncbi:ankyrin repeat domain-containing protein [Sphingobacterium rhinopitheci]|uniref:ankyrin repeat domain-containing protein n=1 Tax=Sphingobacterium rhinopitheci TaxID=2781960 RepID=UPI001F51A7AE|nr:ankyrin repeat domain-containing protein [Sphingobacterium rhinopitheci]
MRIIMMTFISLLTLQSCSANDSIVINMDEQLIIEAVERDDKITVEQALKNGISVNITDSKKRTLLLIATNNANTEMAKLLVAYGADVNKQADNMDSPFLYAGATGQTELVHLYLMNGARFDVFNRYNGTALIPACERGHVETVRLLSNTKDYPINHINRLGWTGLIEAIILGDGTAKYQQIVQILKDAGAQMDLADNQGVTPLELAERLGFTELANIIRG